MNNMDILSNINIISITKIIKIVNNLKSMNIEKNMNIMIIMNIINHVNIMNIINIMNNMNLQTFWKNDIMAGIDWKYLEMLKNLPEIACIGHGLCCVGPCFLVLFQPLSHF